MSNSVTPEAVNTVESASSAPTRSSSSNVLTRPSLQLESDKDLQIRSLYESIEIHKQLVEQSQQEREDATEKRHAMQHQLTEKNRRIQELEWETQKLAQELHSTKQAYQRMETNFYTHMCAIRATDDDLSTIQPEVGHVFNQVNNICMGLKSKMDAEAGTAFVLARWPEKEEWIRNTWFKGQQETMMDSGIITLFMEKYLVDILLQRIIQQPIHFGVSINSAFDELDTWMRTRDKKEWSIRLRQQLVTLLVRHPLTEKEQEEYKEAENALLQEILQQLLSVYPSISVPTIQKKLEALVQRTCKLASAIKGQDLDIHPLTIHEGTSQFNPDLMKAVNRGKADGTVFLVIVPPFVVTNDDEAADSEPEQGDHVFVVQGKVLCL